jgi:hypothetical protein
MYVRFPSLIVRRVSVFLRFDRSAKFFTRLATFSRRFSPIPTVTAVNRAAGARTSVFVRRVSVFLRFGRSTTFFTRFHPFGHVFPTFLSLPP